MTVNNHDLVVTPLWWKGVPHKGKYWTSLFSRPYLLLQLLLGCYHLVDGIIVTQTKYYCHKLDMILKNYCRILLEKLGNTQLRNFLPCIEPRGSQLYSQDSIMEFWPEPEDSSHTDTNLWNTAQFLWHSWPILENQVQVDPWLALKTQL